MYARCVTMGDVFRIWNEHGVMNGINLSTGLALLGRAVARDRSLVNRIRDSYEFRDMCKLLRSKLCDNPDWTGARQLATAAHAFAKLNPANARGQDTRNEVAAMATVGRAATAKIREFNTQELSNTAWAFATAQHPEPVLFQAIGSSGRPQSPAVQGPGNLQHLVGLREIRRAQCRRSVCVARGRRYKAGLQQPVGLQPPERLERFVGLRESRKEPPATVRGAGTRRRAHRAELLDAGAGECILQCP